MFSKKQHLEQCPASDVYELSDAELDMVIGGVGNIQVNAQGLASNVLNGNSIANGNTIASGIPISVPVSVTVE